MKFTDEKLRSFREMLFLPFFVVALFCFSHLINNRSQGNTCGKSGIEISIKSQTVSVSAAGIKVPPTLPFLLKTNYIADHEGYAAFLEKEKIRSRLAVSQLNYASLKPVLSSMSCYYRFAQHKELPA